jgi:hypothetical protein
MGGEFGFPLNDPVWGTHVTSSHYSRNAKDAFTVVG